MLGTYGADRDETGAFLVRGMITSYMGLGKEIVIDGSAETRINGQWVRIVPLMASTSYGMGITVIA